MFFNVEIEVFFRTKGALVALGFLREGGELEVSLVGVGFVVEGTEKEVAHEAGVAAGGTLHTVPFFQVHCKPLFATLATEQVLVLHTLQTSFRTPPFTTPIFLLTEARLTHAVQVYVFRKLQVFAEHLLVYLHLILTLGVEEKQVLRRLADTRTEIYSIYFIEFTRFFELFKNNNEPD